MTRIEAKLANLETLIYKLETEREISFDSDVMLVGETEKSGTVFYRGQYVCDSGWGPEEARVVCRELGYSTNDVFATRKAYFGEPNHGHSNWFHCSGSESRLSDCRKMTGGSFCPSSNAAGVFCGPALELKGGSGPHEGNVFFRGAPVCGLNKSGQNGDMDRFSSKKNKASTVVCKMLGYTRATDAFYGQNITVILLKKFM